MRKLVGLNLAKFDRKFEDFEENFLGIFLRILSKNFFDFFAVLLKVLGGFFLSIFGCFRWFLFFDFLSCVGSRGVAGLWSRFGVRGLSCVFVNLVLGV